MEQSDEEGLAKENPGFTIYFGKPYLWKHNNNEYKINCKREFFEKKRYVQVRIPEI